MSLIDDTIDEYLSTKGLELRAKTMKWYTYHLGTLSDWCKENRISEPRELVTPQMLRRVNDEVHFENPTSRHGYMQVVRGFLNWCSTDEDLKIKELTLRRFRLPKVEEEDVEVFSDAEVKKLFKAAAQSVNPVRDAAIIQLLLDTGIRIAELMYDSTRPQERTGLLLSDVYLKKRGSAESSYIVVMGKGRKERSINIGVRAELALREYLRKERGRPNCTHLFVSRRNEPLGIRWTESLLKSLGEKAGIKDVHPHRFRHTFAVNALLSGVPELLLMRIMGHESLAATKIYVRAVSKLQARNAVPSTVDRIFK